MNVLKKGLVTTAVLAGLSSAVFADIPTELERYVLAEYKIGQENWLDPSQGDLRKYQYLNESGNGIEWVKDRHGNDDSAIKMRSEGYLTIYGEFPFGAYYHDLEGTVAFWYKAGEKLKETLLRVGTGNNESMLRVYIDMDRLIMKTIDMEENETIIFDEKTDMVGWHQIALTHSLVYNEEDEIEEVVSVYLDGQLKNKVNFDFLNLTGGPWYMGDQDSLSEAYPDKEGFYLDDLNLFSKALNNQEVAMLYSGTDGELPDNSTPAGFLSGKAIISADAGLSTWSGTKCVVSEFSSPFDNVPAVSVTANKALEAGSTTTDGSPVVVWNDYVTKTEFKTCAKDLITDQHAPVEIHWMAK
ncbi:LamG-like jellyroll fold domain-containing protein [Marinomonas mediterranea]|uniref:LamG-like jellyroll fold domain-containing protein n=1 Tax=Marinomonas mediterranea TaxID=119864 RepID=UPI00234BF355|nr:LamG-like jellyroll fold domain-containing protein [Marinomonas mediterranea]WCN08190.1 hypothetical protein GV055_04290 [Marinomonas mediterranea]